MSVKQQQGTGYQLDLFDEALKKSVRPDASGESGTGSGAYEEQQALTAFAQQRALTQNLMEQIASSSNLNQAYKRVKANKGAPGVDGMTVRDLHRWIADNRDALAEQLLRGTYRPQPVKGVQTPKPGGGMRQLGIPTVVDRLVQQAILQVLQPIFDPSFSDSSFGFRPGRNAHGAVARAREYVSEGHDIVADLDLEKFFDRVNHDVLMSRLARRIGDRRLLRIIRRFLQAGMMQQGLDVIRYEGTPQGSPLSPLLANILLDDLDKELERRGHRFVRYADDCNIYVRSLRAGERVMASVTRFLEKRLRLKVNGEKSAVAPVKERSFLSYRLWPGGFVSIAPRSLERAKDRLRQMTRRNRGLPLERIINEVNTFLSGWVTYFRMARCREHLLKLDQWLRRRLRCYRIKQCKRIFTLVTFLRQQGIDKERSWWGAMSHQGWWRASMRPTVREALSKQWFKEQGLLSATERYSALQSSENRLGT